jgi:hypothetical protein
MSEHLEHALKAAEALQRRAMLANDGAALAGLLDPRLQFHHATGVVDDREAYLAKMAAGRIRYVGNDWAEEHVISLAHNAATLSGMMTTSVQVDGVDKVRNNQVTTVSSRNNGT